MLSVVVPVYNVEKYLDKCVATILAQTVQNMEVILVDDGSTDSSGMMCDAWAEKDNRITVYHKSNGGLMSAWKYGVSRASGDYIGFVDSDDWVDPDMYERMLSTAQETGAEMVCVSLVSEYEDGRQVFQSDYLKPGFYDRERILAEISPILLTSHQHHDRSMFPSRVTKLFKAGVLKAVLSECNERISIGEDLVTTFAYLQIANSIFKMDQFWPYHYRINNESMIRSFSMIKYEKIDLLKQALLSINEMYHTYDYRTQIYTDYLALYFRTMENQILSSTDSGLIKSLRQSFRADSIREALVKADQTMLSKKHRMYLSLMKLGLVRFVVWIRRVKGQF